MKDFEKKMNELGKRKEPFLFILDFELKTPHVIPLNKVNSREILYQLRSKRNHVFDPKPIERPVLNIKPVPKKIYCEAFSLIRQGISHGDSFLTNLTMPAKVELDLSLKDIFTAVTAKYKLYFKDLFVVFSPEPFVLITSGKIRSFPMKGTIDAAVPRAEEKLLSDPKELSEHYTIVDLIRNDLSMVAKNVKVNRFRYIEKVKTHQGALLQMSSEISGELPDNYQEQLGTIFRKLLPAGSISGAPKKKTVEMIKKAEPYDRGFYTGVFGIFDGQNVESAVMIRFLEKTQNGYIYKSGGGITAYSRCEDEYDELIKKIYVPFA
jgi:para-aminobenzoate synthetase component 1